MEIQKIKSLIKKSIREVLREERLLLCKSLMPFISNEEQAEIDVEFGSPSDVKASDLLKEAKSSITRLQKAIASEI
jgi:hypothetical protein